MTTRDTSARCAVDFHNGDPVQIDRIGEIHLARAVSYGERAVDDSGTDGSRSGESRAAVNRSETARRDVAVDDECASGNSGRTRVTARACKRETAGTGLGDATCAGKFLRSANIESIAVDHRAAALQVGGVEVRDEVRIVLFGLHDAAIEIDGRAAVAAFKFLGRDGAAIEIEGAGAIIAADLHLVAHVQFRRTTERVGAHG